MDMSNIATFILTVFLAFPALNLGKSFNARQKDITFISPVNLSYERRLTNVIHQTFIYLFKNIVLRRNPQS